MPIDTTTINPATAVNVNTAGTADRALDVAQAQVDTAIIGRIPGYNSNIDKDGAFARNLLKGVTFIDMMPMSYKLMTGLAENGGTGAAAVKNFFDNLPNLIKQPALFMGDPNAMQTIFSGILKRMERDFQLSSGFSSASSLRIIAANDSTFTETFSNDFGQENGLVQLGKQAIGNIKADPTSKFSKLMSFGTKAMRGYSYTEMVNLAGGLARSISDYTQNQNIADLISGAFAGMNIAAPRDWGGSSYTSSLTLFIKLVAPVGTPTCIKKNILEPILYLLAAASPITYAGSMYGFPLMWDVQAKGITNFRLGAIAAMSIIRGSFETTFNYLLQPTVVDVRLTLVPLLTDFASQTDINENSIYTPEAANYFGVQNPSDLYRGVTNDKPDTAPIQTVSIKL